MQLEILKRSPHQQRVDRFMRNAKQDLPVRPTLPDEKTRRLRAKLILEEALETVKELGFDVEVNGLEISSKKGFKEFVTFSSNPDNASLEGIADGCADIIVVTTGTLSACGISDEGVQKEVDVNNLAKFGPGHSWNEDGKLIKPSSHRPPDIAGVLAAQTNAADEVLEREAKRNAPPPPPPPGLDCYGENYNPSSTRCRGCEHREPCVRKYLGD